MKLTRRQEEFIYKLLDLYQELKGPIHYSTLAEHLGVSPFTAYDMLCLLEEKGFVTSKFQLASGKSGPGRSERLFYPTGAAEAMVQRLTDEAGGENWENVKEYVLQQIRTGEVQDKELANEMLVRNPPDAPEQLRYCIEVMTIIALRLRRRTGRRLLVQYLNELLPDVDASNRANLSLLGGLAFGILAEENSDDSEWVQELFDHVRKYQSTIMDMSAKLRHQLVEDIREVFDPLINMT